MTPFDVARSSRTCRGSRADRSVWSRGSREIAAEPREGTALRAEGSPATQSGVDPFSMETTDASSSTNAASCDDERRLAVADHVRELRAAACRVHRDEHCTRPCAGEEELDDQRTVRQERDHAVARALLRSRAACRPGVLRVRRRPRSSRPHRPREGTARRRGLRPGRAATRPRCDPTGTARRAR